MRKFKPEELTVEEDLLTGEPMLGEVNIESLVFRQIERCSIAATQDESLFAANVRVLLSMLPEGKRKEVLEQSDEYIEKVERWQYRYWCGVPVGTPENPINGSPSLVQEDVYDWHKLFELILKALEDSNLTWRYEKWTIEVGKVEEDKVEETPIPTPLLPSEVKQSETPKPLPEQPTDDKGMVPEKKQRIRRCAICGQHIAPKTGVFYQQRLVHKESCWAVARAKWSKEVMEKGLEEERRREVLEYGRTADDEPAID